MDEELLFLPDEIAKMASESMGKIHEIYNQGTEIENFLLDMFELNFTTHEHEYLLIYINSVRRNFLLSGFLILSKQMSAGFQVMRSMIESGEILVSYLLNSTEVINIINSDFEKNTLYKVQSIGFNQIKIINNQNINKLCNGIREWKELINNFIAHSNPNLSLSKLSGVNKTTMLGSIFDSDEINWKHNYLVVLKCFNDIVHLIFLISEFCEFNKVKNSKIKYPNFNLERFIIDSY